MAEPILSTNKTQTTASSQTRVVCDGPEGSHHPRVYLTMVDDKNGQPDHVVCPYCSQTFVYTGK